MDARIQKYIPAIHKERTTGKLQVHKVGLSSPNRTCNYFELTIITILNIYAKTYILSKNDDDKVVTIKL